MANAETLTIEVLGSGCAKCKTLHERTQAAVTALGWQTEVLYSNDIEKIIALGVMSSPVLAVNGKAVLVGALPDEAELTTILTTQEQSAMQ